MKGERREEGKNIPIYNTHYPVHDDRFNRSVMYVILVHNVSVRHVDKID